LVSHAFAQQQEPFFFFFDVFTLAALVFLAGSVTTGAVTTFAVGAGVKVKLPAGGYATIDGAVGKVMVGAA